MNPNLLLTSKQILLQHLNVKKSDRLVHIGEVNLADSNFVFTHLMKQVYSEETNSLCLLLLHNSLDHYLNVGKKLGFDLQKKIESGSTRCINVLSIIAEKLGCEDFPNSSLIYEEVERNLKELKRTFKSTYLFVDDLSHLMDLGVTLAEALRFVNLLGRLSSEENLNVIVNCHSSDNPDVLQDDTVLSNALEYIADVSVKVSPLKTGWSEDVTGVVRVKNCNSEKVYHYKASDKEIRTFTPGESIKYLRC